MEPGEKGSVVQHAFGLGHRVLDGIGGRTLSSPRGPSSGSVLKPQASSGQTPLAIPVCSEVPTSEFLVSGRRQHGGDGQHL